MAEDDPGASSPRGDHDLDAICAIGSADLDVTKLQGMWQAGSISVEIVLRSASFSELPLTAPSTACRWPPVKRDEPLRLCRFHQGGIHFDRDAPLQEFDREHQ
jgi:hypothetical protein